MFCMTISATRAQAVQQTTNDNLQETRTDRLLDQSSYNPTSHNNFDKTSTTRLWLAWQPTRQDWLPKQHFLVKTTTTRTLLDGTLTVTLIPTLRPTSTLALFTTATILYNIQRHPWNYCTYTTTLQYKCNAHKPIPTLRGLLSNVKDKDKLEDRQGTVYKIKCCNCQASYIGETGRNLSMRLTEHKCAKRNGDFSKSHYWVLLLILWMKHQLGLCDMYYIIVQTTIND